jgi:hypothetical protein
MSVKDKRLPSLADKHRQQAEAAAMAAPKKKRARKGSIAKVVKAAVKRVARKK